MSKINHNDIDDTVKTYLQRALKIVDTVTDPQDGINPGTKLIAATNILPLLIEINLSQLDDDTKEDNGSLD